MSPKSTVKSPAAKKESKKDSKKDAGAAHPEAAKAEKKSAKSCVPLNGLRNFLRIGL